MARPRLNWQDMEILEEAIAAGETAFEGRGCESLRPESLSTAPSAEAEREEKHPS